MFNCHKQASKWADQRDNMYYICSLKLANLPEFVLTKTKNIYEMPSFCLARPRPVQTAAATFLNFGLCCLQKKVVFYFHIVHTA